MDEFLGRIQDAIEESGTLPWPHGADHENLSEEAARAWRILTEEELLAISRHNPFKKERDKAFHLLQSKGVIMRILAELSGLTCRAVDVALKRTKRNIGK